RWPRDWSSDVCSSDLGADEEAINFPVIYASGRQGVATTDLKVEPKNLQPLYRAILENIPAREVDPEAPLQMLVASVINDPYVGQIGRASCRERVASWE